VVSAIEPTGDHAHRGPIFILQSPAFQGQTPSLVNSQSTSEEVLLLEETPEQTTAPAPQTLLPKPKLWLKILQVLLGFAVIFTVMAKIEFAGPAILDNDGYYHIRWSKILRESAPHLPPFKSLPLTTLNEQSYVDHHFLFHVLLMPFTFGDLRIGAKLASAVFSSLALTSLFALLVAYNVPYRWLWLAPLAASSEPFLYRMSMTRAPSLSLALLGIGAYLILQRRNIWYGVASFIFVWLYSMFPLMLVMAVAYTIAVYLAGRRIDMWALLTSFCGIAAGLVANPYFPNNLTLFKEHLLMKVTGNYSVDVGVEWYPYETWVILSGSAVAFAIYAVAVIAFDFRRRTSDVKPLFFLIVSAVMLLMAFKSRRFIEYWPPFAVLFAAFTFSSRGRLAGPGWFKRTRDRAIAAAAASVAGFALIVGLVANVTEAYADVKSEQDPFAYKGASEWLMANTPPGSMVFNTDWDDFPMLFYYNTHNTYIVGLDPTYLYDRDHDMWKVYAKVTLGQEDNPAPIIRDRFGAEYVFTDNEHSDFLDVAESTGDFETVYSDKYTRVLRVRGPDEPRPEKKTEADDDDDDDGK
jgi:asparagine N-glycosylation enzyme membrane subunit Stt3